MKTPVCTLRWGYGDTLGLDATWMRSDEATEGLLFLNHSSATVATKVLEAIAAAGHSRDISYRDCVQMLRKVRACRTPQGWQAVPVQRKVGALCKKLEWNDADRRTPQFTVYELHQRYRQRCQNCEG